MRRTYRTADGREFVSSSQRSHIVVDTRDASIVYRTDELARALKRSRFSSAYAVATVVR